MELTQEHLIALKNAFYLLQEHRKNYGAVFKGKYDEDVKPLQDIIEHLENCLALSELKDIETHLSIVGVGSNRI